MNEQKRQWITEEIEHWKKSNLLPDKYCRFLMNLYKEDSVQDKKWLGLSINNWACSRFFYWTAAFFLISLFGSILLNFNPFGISLQIGISLFFIVCLYGTGIYIRKRSDSAARLLCLLATLTLVLFGPYLFSFMEGDVFLFNLIYLLGCCVFVLLVGWFFHWIWFQYAAWIGFSIIYGRFLLWLKPGISAGIFEMAWIPASLIFIWLGWIIHSVNRIGARSFWWAGITLFFIPELYTAAAGGTEDWRLGITMIFLIKMVLATIILYGYRKKWIEWIA